MKFQKNDDGKLKIVLSICDESGIGPEIILKALSSHEIAEEIEILTTLIKNNIKENNTLFIYGHKPIFYYLTECEPSVNKIWLANNVIQVDELFFELEESIIDKKKYGNLMKNSFSLNKKILIADIHEEIGGFPQKGTP